jgi:hypothetical protein
MQFRHEEDCNKGFDIYKRELIFMRNVDPVHIFLINILNIVLLYRKRSLPFTFPDYNILRKSHLTVPAEILHMSYSVL